MDEVGMGAHAGVFDTTSGPGDSNIPGNIDGNVVDYMYFDGYSGSGDGYRVWPGTSDSEHQEFTMIFDLFVPTSNSSSYIGIFNGNDGNSNDADYLLTPSNTGVYGDSNANLWEKGKWQRIALVTDHTRGSAKLYVDGDEVSDINSRDFVWGGGNGLHFWVLSDDNGNHSAGYISAFAFAPTALAPSDLFALGGVDAGGIFEVGFAGCPRGLRYQTDIDAQEITLTWRAAGESFDAAGIKVFRDGTEIASLPIGADSFVDSVAGGPPVAEYEYTLQTFGGANGDECSPLSVTAHYSAAGIAGDLIAYYRFEGDAADVSGSQHVHDGTVAGSPSFFPEGKVGRGLRLQSLAAPTEYVVADAHADLDFGSDQDFTVALWARHLGNFANDTAIGGSASDPAMLSNKNWNSGSNRGWFIGGDSDGRWIWNIGDGSDRADFTLGSRDVTGDGAWHHVLVAHDRDGSATFYLDGQAVGSTNLGSIGDIDAGLPTVIGNDGGLGNYQWDGDIDEVAIWRRVLTPAEAEEVYTRGASGRTITGTNALDSDRDGMPDGWEIAFFGNLSRDGTGDYDSDGRSDFAEYSAGSSPLAGQSDTELSLHTMQVEGEEHAAITYRRPRVVEGVRYIPETSDGLGTWHGGDALFEVVGAPVDVGGGIDEWTLCHAEPIGDNPRAFFRLRKEIVYQGAFAGKVEPSIEYRGGTAIVRWETPTAAPTIIEYTLGDGTTVRLEDFDLNSSHRVFIDGAGEADDFSFSVVYIQDGLEQRSENVSDETFYDFGPPAFPEQNGFDTGGGYAALAAQILAETGVTKGYCLDVSCGDGKLAFELARQSDLIVMGAELDPALANSARTFLAGRGVYGSRVTVTTVDSLSSLPFNKRTFNLIVSSATYDGRSSIANTGPVAYLEEFLAPGRGKAAFSLSGGSLGQIARAPLPDAGKWTHQYGGGGNCSYAGEQLGGGVDSAGDMGLQWLGRPGGSFTVDRQVRAPAPLATNGRLFAQGHDRIVALESHNGAVLWSKKIPGLTRLNAIRDSGNMCADDDALFLAVGDECWKIDGDSGDRTSFAVEPAAAPGVEYGWGFVGRTGNVLLGSAMRPGAAYKKFWGAKYWFDGQSGFGTDQVCSDNLFARDPASGALLWEYEDGVVLNISVTTGDDKIWFLESRSSSAMTTSNRQMSMSLLKPDLYLTCLDVATGAMLWDAPQTFDGGTPCVYLSYDSGVLVLSTSRESNDNFYVYGLDPADGSQLWAKNHAWRSSHHGGNHQHPVIMGGKVYLEPRVYDLSTGAQLASNMPSRSGCSTFIGTGDALIYRGNPTIQYGGNVAMWGVDSGASSQWDRVRPSCWISAIAADGVVVVQDGGAGCSCGGWMELSFAVAPQN